MKRILYRLIWTLILAAGLFVGMVKGQEARNKWITKMKARFEAVPEKKQFTTNEVILDDIEMAAFHSN